MPVESYVWHGPPYIGQVPRRPSRSNSRRICWKNCTSSSPSIQPMDIVVHRRWCGTERVSGSIEKRCTGHYGSNGGWSINSLGRPARGHSVCAAEHSKVISGGRWM